jgi:polyisoprenoid-binding protein YceI
VNTQRSFRIACLVAVLAAHVRGAQDVAIDPARSTITVHVRKAGLLSVAGHEHWITAPISAGAIDTTTPRVELRIEVSRMEVTPDPQVSAKDQSQIQAHMLEALEAPKFPEIRFQSSRVEAVGDKRWQVHGALTLHGVSKGVVMTVAQDGEAYTGQVGVKQTDFSMKPVSVGGGLVKVKDEVEIDFRIVTRRAEADAPAR